ncbi:TPA_asm: hypothetical protein [ssRNA phage Gephyllon.1_10]|uniref:Uncharacterized protein n=2 Tax=Fiersviridae TaxID=2842319 RepID=A0A8S5L3A1_9VIRU|nr:hypothetical protein QIJ80_gp1 [ssRNA phage Gephyllon.1_10]QDH89404.1 MAG: hypothetical protein H1BulkLitter4482_000004 [Leviviridae sp.]DAD52145.1 TPA_asm: hypothetical protein [ssRNA phage Gephyllon.1_10]
MNLFNKFSEKFSLFLEIFQELSVVAVSFRKLFPKKTTVVGSVPPSTPPGVEPPPH